MNGAQEPNETSPLLPSKLEAGGGAKTPRSIKFGDFVEASRNQESHHGRITRSLRALSGRLRSLIARHTGMSSSRPPRLGAYHGNHN